MLLRLLLEYSTAVLLNNYNISLERMCIMHRSLLLPVHNIATTGTSIEPAIAMARYACNNHMQLAESSSCMHLL